MTTLAAPATLPMVLTEVEVESAERLSPSFVRLTLSGTGLADVGVDGPLWDQRFKLIVPDASGGLTSVTDADETWLATWMERPVEDRGHMRTYTIRSLTGEGDATRLVVDIVVHEGASGPGADWALAAVPGSRAVVLMPRKGAPFGGIEFTPEGASRLLLVGDESAVPAICAILEQLPAGASGAAYVEVAVDADIQRVTCPVGVEVTWLVRGERAHGEALQTAVLDHLGAGVQIASVEPDEVDPDLWETPTWSSSGETLETGRSVGHDFDGLYAWIAGESRMVTGLRRALVKDLGVDRQQVAFMGYWRHGVAMKS